MIEVKGLKKEFDGLKVLNGIDYTINQGEKDRSDRTGAAPEKVRFCAA